MSEAPERILVESECGHANAYNSEDRRTWLHFPDNAQGYFYAEYVRADRIEELEAKLAVAVTHFKKLRRRQYSIETFDAVVNEIVEAALAELTGGKDE